MIVKLDVNDLSNFNFYKNCFCDLDNIQQNFFIEKIRRMNNIEPKEEETEELIKTIINDADFINLIDQIMKSKVINNAYYLINQLSLTNGNINLNEKMEIKLNNIEEEEEKEENYKNINLNKIEGLIISNSEKTGNIAEEKNSKINAHKNNDNIDKKCEPKNNLINEKSITYYYNKFLKTFDKTNYSNIFIIMGLPKNIKGFTFRFLKIILNYNGININSNDLLEKNILLKSYLILLIIYEINQFIQRYFNVNDKINLCDTPKINNYNEGGNQLLEMIFGNELIHKNINLDQAKYILNIANWSKSIYEFKDEFMKINTDDKKESIVYLNLDHYSYCDHSMLHA